MDPVKVETYVHQKARIATLFISADKLETHLPLNKRVDELWQLVQSQNYRIRKRTNNLYMK